jgi:1,4-dihydroxy-2-naphthoyl-CoA hydrolase
VGGLATLRFVRTPAGAAGEGQAPGGQNGEPAADPGADPEAVDQAAVDVAGGLLGHLGIVVRTATPDRVLLELPVGPHLHQPFGLVHGGVYCTLVETAASIGASLAHAGHGQVVGVANHTDFLRAVREGTLTAVGTPIHRGRSQQLWLVEVSDQVGRLIARGEVRLSNLGRRLGGGRRPGENM